MTKRRPPKGWHRGKPRKKGVYRTAPTHPSIMTKTRVKGWGKALWDGKQWHRWQGWGSHFDATDFVWQFESAEALL